MTGPASSQLSAVPGRPRVLLAVAAVGLSAIMTQLALLREMLTVFAGNEMVVGIILGNWMLLTGLGATLGRTTDRLRHRETVLLSLLILVALIPLGQVCMLRGLRTMVFLRGEVLGVTATVLSSAAVLLPYCLVAGYLLVLACSLLADDPGRTGIGWVYVADGVGSIVGGLVFGLVLVYWLDHLALLCVPAVLCLMIAGWLGKMMARPRLANLAWTVAVAVVGVPVTVDLDARSTAWQYPQQTVRFRGHSPYGKLVVTETAGQLNFVENGVAMFSTPSIEEAEETVHYAMAQRPDARQVLLVGGGISGTVDELLKYQLEGVTYVELDPLVLEVGRRLLPAPWWSDRRVRIVTADGRQFVRRGEGRHDVILVDLPDPSTALLNRFYTVEFFREAKRLLAPNGVLSLAVGHYENYVSPELSRLLASTCATAKSVFSHVTLIPGGRVFFLASDGDLTTDIAGRLEDRAVRTRFVNRHYLDAMLRPDRLGELDRAIGQPAKLNRDFDPVLYFYHLRHWMSQFSTQGRVWWVLGALALIVYLFWLEASSLVVFASGFAGAGLQFVLLLVYQVLCGSLYQQVCVFLAVFMLGLTLGSLGATREIGRKFRWVAAADGVLARLRRVLGRFALGLAVFSGALPFGLRLLHAWGRDAALLWAVQLGFGFLTLVLGALVGIVFPLASAVVRAGPAGAGARLYTADFVGGAVGALLVSAWAVPVLGVAGACSLSAALNLLGWGGMRWRK